MSRRTTTRSKREQLPEDLRKELDAATPAQFRQILDRLAETINVSHHAHQLSAAAAQVSARASLIESAHELLPVAKAFAAKGRPRLLAVLTKIINDRNVKFGSS